MQYERGSLQLNLTSNYVKKFIATKSYLKLCEEETMELQYTMDHEASDKNIHESSLNWYI